MKTTGMRNLGGPLRVAYGTLPMLSRARPFGVYHSRVKPHIVDHRWAWKLPSEYAGLLLGPPVIRQPRLPRLRRPGSDTLLILSGAPLPTALALQPGLGPKTVINLSQGTQFTGGEIDLNDYGVGFRPTLLLNLLPLAVEATRRTLRSRQPPP